MPLKAAAHSAARPSPGRGGGGGGGCGRAPRGGAVRGARCRRPAPGWGDGGGGGRVPLEAARRAVLRLHLLDRAAAVAEALPCLTR